MATCRYFWNLASLVAAFCTALVCQDQHSFLAAASQVVDVTFRDVTGGRQTLNIVFDEKIKKNNPLATTKTGWLGNAHSEHAEMKHGTNPVLKLEVQSTILIRSHDGVASKRVTIPSEVATVDCIANVEPANCFVHGAFVPVTWKLVKGDMLHIVMTDEMKRENPKHTTYKFSFPHGDRDGKKEFDVMNLTKAASQTLKLRSGVAVQWRKKSGRARYVDISKGGVVDCEKPSKGDGSCKYVSEF